jgi:hypothetical protein
MTKHYFSDVIRRTKVTAFAALREKIIANELAINQNEKT